MKIKVLKINHGITQYRKEVRTMACKGGKKKGGCKKGGKKKGGGCR